MKKKDEVNFIPLKIANETVETVDSFKYLGTTIDTKIAFDENTDNIYKKCQQRLYLLRKLRSFDVCPEILQTVYKSMVESVLSFNIVCWYGFLNLVSRKKLDRIVSLANKIIGIPQNPVIQLYKQALSRKGKSIVSSKDHPLLPEFDLLPSGRRYRVPVSRKKFRHSFVPSAITVLNSGCRGRI